VTSMALAEVACRRSDHWAQQRT